jgi:hypothetical protein
MLHGYTLPRTPKGASSLAPMPPWHYVGTCLAVEYEAAPDAVRAFLPSGLDFDSPRCATYFVEWQYASKNGEEYLDPSRSQYHETIFLISASYQGNRCAYCPFIWVDHPYLELPDLRPTNVLAGYRFSCALTVDDLILLQDLRAK